MRYNVIMVMKNNISGRNEMAVRGIGIDIIEIARVGRAMKNQRFRDRVFTPKELEYFNSRGDNPCHSAGGFAAKEAVLKALGTGLSGIAWKDIEVLRDCSGKPYVILHNDARSIADAAGIRNIFISISHSRDYAAAQAVAEGHGDYDEACNCAADEKC